jgi:uncharacterized membrane protein
MHHGARLFFSHFGHHVGPFGLLGHVFFPLFGLSLLGLLIALPFLVWALTRSSRPMRHAAPAAPALPYDATALQILRERYARGEIDGATFDEQLSHLLRSTAPAASYEAPWETPPEDWPEDQGPSNL